MREAIRNRGNYVRSEVVIQAYAGAARDLGAENVTHALVVFNFCSVGGRVTADLRLDLPPQWEIGRFRQRIC